ncbi:MAG: hypothetical protein ACLFS2_02390 [Halochromatium sp.]|uniref:hypothetical protein n=1 Tax=Halochromatium sp. TaxID=2049430 RepID=UPI00397B207B
MSEAISGAEKAWADGIAENTAKADGADVGGSFFEQLAAMMGEIVGEIEEEMNEAGEKMQDAKDGSDEFSKAQTEFQAKQQEFSMMMEVVSTILKGVGQAAQTMARSQ